MLTKIIAIFLIFLFVLLTVIAIVAFIYLHKQGLLKTFMKGQMLLSLLSLLFVIAFITSGTGMLLQAEWALPVLSYTIYGWLIYVWLYGLKKLLDMIALLKWETAKSVSQLMGRSKLFDELIEKSIEISKQSDYSDVKGMEGANAVSDSEWENLINDEEWFKDVFPVAIRKRIKRKVIGLLVHTAIFVVILVLIK